MDLFLIWHCVDVANCQKGGDLSNIAATYIGIITGFVLGGIISWWIYNRQEKTAGTRHEILDHIVNLEEKHEHILEKHEFILEKIQIFEQNHDKMLNNILTIDKKINSLLENK